MDTQPNTNTALITGASSGIGKALAKEFATHDYDVILVAPHRNSLRTAREEIQAITDVDVWIYEKDLTLPDAVTELYEEVQKLGRPITTLVNDAGIGQRGNFAEIPFSKYKEIIHLNILALTELTHLFLNNMIAQNEGKILQLGSVAGFQPGPYLAVYHATKAYVVSLSEAIATELDELDSKVTITCLCPGPTDTHFFSRADMEKTRVVDKKDSLMKQPEDVAKGAYEALMDGERIYIPGATNKMMTFIRRVIPKSLQARMQKQFYEEVEEEK
ncbi:SDR family oxidoreductase [uncultured Marixanthomonas sp.]|uniref:SDR family NAD(P)-dependent oxidoreductase n=1 Tax=uncultured Marixanthomonas sp. TaxID=757245 RepID=UPI0030DBC488|tara:strand:+ start:9396 stop:10214 length:819 start_codon:yes stop_codon:yes gene_type:complete